MVRRILGVVVGVVIGMAVVMHVEKVGHEIWPPPEGMDLTDPESIRALMGELPLGSLAMVLVAWTLGALLGSTATGRITGSCKLAIIPGALILLAALAMLFMIPHPWWFWPGTLLLVPGATWLGCRIGAPASGASAGDGPEPASE